MALAAFDVLMDDTQSMFGYEVMVDDTAAALRKALAAPAASKEGKPAAEMRYRCKRCGRTNLTGSDLVDGDHLVPTNAFNPAGLCGPVVEIEAKPVVVDNQEILKRKE
jgi:hypothetical protein